MLVVENKKLFFILCAAIKWNRGYGAQRRQRPAHKEWWEGSIWHSTHFIRSGTQKITFRKWNWKRSRLEALSMHANKILNYKYVRMHRSSGPPITNVDRLCEHGGHGKTCVGAQQTIKIFRSPGIESWTHEELEHGRRYSTQHAMHSVATLPRKRVPHARKRKTQFYGIYIRNHVRDHLMVLRTVFGCTCLHPTSSCGAWMPPECINRFFSSAKGEVWHSNHFRFRVVTLSWCEYYYTDTQHTCTHRPIDLMPCHTWMLVQLK